MAIQHAQSGDPIDIRPLGARLGSEKNIALFKSEQLEVIRLVLLAGKVFPPHAVPGEITLQCIEGEIDVTVDGESHVLKPNV
jgi:quercetin dioxygenase-like cupin family protein